MAEGKLAEIASREGTEADARARRALILNKEKAWSAYWNSALPSSAMSDEERVDTALRREELLAGYNAACEAVRAFDAHKAAA
jgi:hypothetical protein